MPIEYPVMAKNFSKNFIRIIAPGGNVAHIRAAVGAGADAVYAGPKFMSGRSGYAEMSLEVMAQARKITADSGVKLYAAINRSIPIGGKDRWKAGLQRIADIGPDALIIGSYCVYTLVKKMGFEIPLHASTFWGIYNAEDVKIVKDLGFKRVIINTGLYSDEIGRMIKNAPDMEYELIAYGGICKNDNHRCNLPHGLRDKPPSSDESIHSKESTYCQLRLNLADVEDCTVRQGRLMCYPVFDASPYLRHFTDMGITNFKIAGRERPAEFVKNAVLRLKKGVETLDQPMPSLPQRGPYFYKKGGETADEL